MAPRRGRVAWPWAPLAPDSAPLAISRPGRREKKLRFSQVSTEHDRVK